MTDVLAPSELAIYAPAPYRVDEDEIVTCPHCQLKDDVDASFCDQCGTELTGRDDVKVGDEPPSADYAPEPYDPESDESVVCPDCEKRNDTDCKFCDQCGCSMVGRTDVLVDGPVENVDDTGEEADDGEDQPRSTPKPRDSLIRSVEFRAEPSADGLTLEGYAAVFDDPAMINSWEGTFRERMMPGAFDKTIAEHKPVLMFDHGQHPMVGSIPIGTITALRPDARGLYVKATLADNWLIEPVRDAVRSGAISGMSIRMSVIQDDWGVGKDRVPERSIREVALAELGPVVFPAYENTQVSVRSRELITALADPEVRTELARIFASGTDVESAAPDPEPEVDHSVRSFQLRARLALADS